LAAPQTPRGAIAEALKRRADLMRRIERAEAEWLAAAEAVDRGAQT
jgi:hypothetical protein